ncbi:MAG TPA: FG-GAP-like repeat-containing protein [Terriglobia bacterium]|nr:FG-GAP-like repeat-containing protein [Terriglobia bacterium]
MKGSGRYHSISICLLVSTAVLFWLFCRPPVAAAVEFSNAISYAAGINPVAIVTGDFNGDGKPDLAVVNAGDGTTTNPGNVSILLGKGDGTFQAAVNYPAGQSPNSIAVGDFNGDGKLDLAVANQGIALQAIDGTVSILLGKGDGTFQAAVDYTAGKIPYSIAAGDFNGDGKPDLAVVNAANSQTATPIDGDLSILLGIGDGTFQPAVDYQPCPSPVSVLLADLNHDGNLDVIALDQSTAAPSGVLLGNGDGTFQSPLPFSAGGQGVLGDFNRDGKLDLALRVDLLLGNGDGTFQPEVTIDLGVFSTVAVATDINGDGKLDLVGWYTAFCFDRTNCTPGVYPAILLGRGDGTFSRLTDTFPGAIVGVKAAADFNGDNLPDLVGIDGSSGKVNILLNASPTSTKVDLALGMSPSNNTLAAGTNQTFRISVLNEGPIDATGVTVTDMLPAELTFVSAKASQGSCQGTSSISCDLGSLLSPGSAMVTITATVNAPGTGNTITNQASVSATESDSNLANNSASAVTNILDFQMSVSATSLTVAAGASASATVSVVPVGGFNQAATLACTGAPSNATCEISPASLALDGSDMASATLTVKTTARSSALPFGGTKPFVFTKPLLIFWATFLMLLLLVACNARDPWRRSAARGLMFATVALLVVTWAACGGGNNTVGSGGPPPEVSTLTITATAGSFTQRATVTLTIK